MFLKKLDLYYQTLKHVKPTQLYHQVYYRFRNKFSSKIYYGQPGKIAKLKFQEGISYPVSCYGEGKFTFLNLEKQFTAIDWNFNAYGKLWTYNLNYFEFLHQEAMTKEEGLKLIRKYISSGELLKDGLEPYPISLRGINWIKFLIENEVQDDKINSFLYRDYLRLADNLEYHLLANHLLENGFSLLFGAYFFKDDQLYKKAKGILVQELEEQVLEDGAHYELSPMYHQIILHRVLDSYNLVKKNNWKEREFLSLLQEKAEIMLGWLEQISFTSGEIPKLNDAAHGIAPTTKELCSYAKRLGLNEKKVALSDSGYRKFKDDNFEVVMDVGQIAPTYQPGHSHADSLQFVLNYKGEPIIVDTGISTYEKNERRQLERSTCSHNTVTIDGKNSSSVWSGFRVAERAEVTILRNSRTKIKASHNGYRNLGITHNRTFEFSSKEFKIEDKLEGSLEKVAGKGHIHFHPDVELELKKNVLLINRELELEISGAESIDIVDYTFAEAFNKLRPAQKIIYQLSNNAQLLFHAASATANAATAAQSLRPPRENQHY